VLVRRRGDIGNTLILTIRKEFDEEFEWSCAKANHPGRDKRAVLGVGDRRFIKGGEFSFITIVILCSCMQLMKLRLQ
jgi:hypothetical protein